ncbi:MAG TPA: hypothetical protein VK498_02955 [Ferruginibacter sp.]|nr:hypothetical protein [Ferruginibacter sp.]
MHEKASNKAMIDVNSSIMLDADEFVICNDVITKRQKPKRLAAVLKICGDVLFAIRILSLNKFVAFHFLFK